MYAIRSYYVENIVYQATNNKKKEPSSPYHNTYLKALEKSI